MSDFNSQEARSYIEKKIQKQPPLEAARRHDNAQINNGKIKQTGNPTNTITNKKPE